MSDLADRIISLLNNARPEPRDALDALAIVGAHMAVAHGWEHEFVQDVSELISILKEDGVPLQ